MLFRSESIRKLIHRDHQFDLPLFVLINPVSGMKHGKEIWAKCERLLKANNIPYEAKGTFYIIILCF